MDSRASTTAPTGNIPAYFTLVLLMSIPIYIMAALVPPETVMFLALTLAPVPILAASILTYRETGWEGAKRLLKRSFDFRRIRKKRWYVPIIFLMPALFSLALGAMILMEEPIPEPLLPILAAPVALLAFFLPALFEEVGWMGYAFDPLRAQRSAVRASILLGIAWALWHIPFYLFADLEPAWIAGQLLALVAIRTLVAWIYGNTGRSVFAAILFHTVYNVCTLAFPSYYSSVGHAITSALIVITAAAVVLLWGPETLAQFRFKGNAELN